MTKVKSKKVFKSIRGLAMSKSAKFIDKAKRPILELQSKNQFQDMVRTAQTRVLNLRKEIIDDLMNVKSLDVAAILGNMNDIEELKKEVEGVATLYKLVFGEKLDVNLDDFTLDVAAADILGAANELEAEDED